VATESPKNLSRRERQIMDVIYERGRASATEVMNSLPDTLSYSAVRTFLRILENKGHLKHRKEGKRYIYLPITPRVSAGKSALKRVLQTFYGGSVEKAVAAILDISDVKNSDEDLERLADLIEQTRKEGR